MSHEITACRRKWQLMKSPRSRSHRQRELGSEILNTKSHFWFGSWWNSEPKTPECASACPRAGRGAVTRQMTSSCLWPGGGLARASEEAAWAQGLGWRSVMMMSRCSAASKMDWPKLGLIKSQGWRCTSAETSLTSKRLWRSNLAGLNPTHSHQQSETLTLAYWQCQAVQCSYIYMHIYTYIYSIIKGINLSSYCCSALTWV